jgi:hypothetical protein
LANDSNCDICPPLGDFSRAPPNQLPVENQNAARRKTIGGSTSPGGGIPAPATVDLTAYVRQEKAAGRHVITIVLRNDTVSSPYATFSSKEGAGSHPELVVTP